MTIALALPLLAAAVLDAPESKRYEIPCPAEIETQQMLPVVPEGLRAIVPPDVHRLSPGIRPKRSALTGVGFIRGGPDTDMILAPFTSSGMIEAGDRRMHRWNFGDSSGVWVSCSYRNTYLTLGTMLPAGLSACFTAYANDRGARFLEAWCIRGDD